MSKSWKIFACLIAVAVMAAVIMGTNAQSRQGHASLTGANGKGTATDPNAVPFPTAPGDGMLPKNTPPPPPAQTVTPQTTATIPSSPAPSSGTYSSSPAPSSTSTPTASTAPTGVSSFTSQYSTPSQDQNNGSDTDVSQSTAPTETAAQRVGRKIRGR